MTPAELRKLAESRDPLDGPYWLTRQEIATLNHSKELLRVAEAAEATHNGLIHSKYRDERMAYLPDCENLAKALAALREVKP